MNTSVLSIENVDIFYKKFQALDGVSFTVEPGETFGLIGLNGAGKTTLIKSILDLRDVDSGQIALDGSTEHTQQVREKLAYLPERFNPPSFLKGIEFLRFSLRLYNTSLSDDEFIKAAEQVALDPDFLFKSVNTYSKGMRQKLGLLGTILTGCKLLILDEPMSGLDPRARAFVKDMLQTVKGEGRTVFLSSHILSDMAEICDRVAVLHNKSIIFLGTPEDMMGKAGHKDLERAFLKLIEQPKAA